MIKLKPGETVRAIGERGTAKIRSIMTSRHAALLEKQIGGFRNWTLDELRLVKRDRSIEVITLTRPVSKLADRFERLGVDEEGKMDPDDKKLVAKVRKQLVWLPKTPFDLKTQGFQPFVRLWWLPR